MSIYIEKTKALTLPLLPLLPCLVQRNPQRSQQFQQYRGFGMRAPKCTHPFPFLKFFHIIAHNFPYFNIS